MKFSLQHTRHWLPGVVFVAALLTTAAQAGSIKPKATFTVDVPQQSRDVNRRGQDGIEYVRPGLVAVWYSEKTNDGELSRRDRLSPTDPWQLKMKLVNTTDGTVQHTLQWPTRKHSSAFVLADSGNPVLLTGPVVHCFDPDFQQLNTFAVRDADEPKEVRLLRASPGGKVVWIVEGSDSTFATPLNSETCAAGPTLVEQRPDATISGSDSMLTETNAKQVGLWSRKTGWKVLYNSECCLSNARFLAQNFIGVTRLDLDMRRHFLILNLNGELLLDDVMEAGYQFGGIITSADGKTAAVVFAQRDISAIETGIEINNTRAKAAFYDLEKQKKIAHLDLNIAGDHLFGLAIAPDSSQFALLDGTKLLVYDLSR